MAELKLLDFSVTLQNSKETKETEESIRDLFSTIIPGINKEKLDIKEMSGGIINKVFQVICGDNKFVIKVFTEKTEHLVRVENSVLALRAVQLAGQGADVLAWFTNGVVYTYQEGEMLTVNGVLNNPKTRRLIVQKVVILNQVDAKSLQIGGVTLPSEYQSESYVRRGFSFLSDDFDGELLTKCSLKLSKTKKSILMEYDWISNEVRSLKLENVFAHGDIWWANVLYDKHTDSVKFVDYDRSGYDPFPYDFSCVLLRMKMNMENLDAPQLSEDEDRSLCRLYIEETRQLKGNNKPVTEEDVNILFAFTKLFKPYAWLSLYLTVLTSVILRDSTFHRFVEPCDRLYIEFKKQYLDYKKQHASDFVKGWEICS